MTGQLEDCVVIDVDPEQEPCHYTADDVHNCPRRKSDAESEKPGLWVWVVQVSPPT